MVDLYRENLAYRNTHTYRGAAAAGEGDNTGEVARWWNHPPPPRHVSHRRPQYIAAMESILTTTPEVEGEPSTDIFAHWNPAPNQPRRRYMRDIRRPWLLPPTGAVITIDPSLYTEYVEETAGPSALFIENPDGSAVSGLAGPIENVLAWETHRYLNRVGSWAARVPVGDQLVSGVPLAKLLKRGWKASIVQENNHPLHRLDLEYLLYRGIVEDKTFDIDESGQPVCDLTGSFRALELAARVTPTVATYTARQLASVASDIEGGIAGGISCPSNANGNITVEFGGDDGNGVISRYARLLTLGNVARWALRESWEQDRPQFIAVDNAPNSGYYLVNQEASDASQLQAGEQGFALIGGTPKVRIEGHGIVNRVVAFGSDFDGSPLSLQWATRVSPYLVRSGTNTDGSFYWYVDDAPSIDAYGLVEMVVHRSDIKNPSDTVATRKAAANVLHAFACGELLKHRSPKVFVEVPVANGSQVWALPGDRIKLQYVGWVELDDGRTTWMEFDQWFLVVERHDKSDPSGVRDVSFVLAAPEVEIELPSLPDGVSLPITDPTGWSGGGGGGPAGGNPGGGGGGGSPLPNCCDDPTVTVPDVPAGDTDPAGNPGTPGGASGTPGVGPPNIITGIGSGRGNGVPPWFGGNFLGNVATTQSWAFDEQVGADPAFDEGSHGGMRANVGTPASDTLDPADPRFLEAGSLPAWKRSGTPAGGGTGWDGGTPTWASDDGEYLGYAENQNTSAPTTVWHWL